MSSPQEDVTSVPMICLFLKPSPFIDSFVADEDISVDADWSESLSIKITHSGLPLWAALYKTPPTTCHTPGKTRPAGYTKAGKWLPSKYIPGKTDKRAGK